MHPVEAATLEGKQGGIASKGVLQMFCPNGHSEFVIGPEYKGDRSVALMTCLQCGSRFDAYAQYGSSAAKAASKAA